MPSKRPTEHRSFGIPAAITGSCDTGSQLWLLEDIIYEENADVSSEDATHYLVNHSKIAFERTRTVQHSVVVTHSVHSMKGHETQNERRLGIFLPVFLRNLTAVPRALAVHSGRRSREAYHGLGCNSSWRVWWSYRMHSSEIYETLVNDAGNALNLARRLLDSAWHSDTMPDGNGPSMHRAPAKELSFVKPSILHLAQGTLHRDGLSFS